MPCGPAPQRTPGFYVGIEALYHTSRTRHQALPTDNLTYMRMLTQNDPLEWTRRIGRLPHDDARTHKSLEKMSAVRRLRLLTRPTRPTAAASSHSHRHCQRLPHILRSSRSVVSTWACVSRKEVTQCISSGSRAWSGRRTIGDALCVLVRATFSSMAITCAQWKAQGERRHVH